MNQQDNKESAESWLDYWSREAKNGEVFSNKAGAKNSELVNFWKRVFRTVSSGASVVDLACGAGSIFADLDNTDSFYLVGLDRSVEALTHLKNRLPSVKLVNGSLANMPLKLRHFDLVVSQFGIEYQGPQAFIDGFRLLKKGGSLVAIVHIDKGLIDLKNKAELNGIRLIEDCDFLTKSITLCDALFNGSEETFNAAADPFVAVEPVIAKYVKQHTTGVHAHLYYGGKTLMQNFRSYAQSDIVTWFEEMAVQLARSRKRIEQMSTVNFTKRDMQAISNELVKLGGEAKFEPFYLSNQSAPLGWCFTAFKSK